jgi:hypothetical protein
MRYLYEFNITIQGWGETEEEALEAAIDAFCDCPDVDDEGVIMDQEEDDEDE